MKYLEKLKWVRVQGEQVHFGDRFVFIEFKVRGGRYYEVYEIKDQNRLFAEVHYSNKSMFAFNNDFGEKVEFYEKKFDSMCWDNFSPRAKRKVFKEIEKAFINQFPNAL